MKRPVTQSEFEELLDELPDYEQASAIADWEADSEEMRMHSLIDFYVHAND